MTKQNRKWSESPIHDQVRRAGLDNAGEAQALSASAGSAFDAEKKAIEFQEEFYPKVGKMTAAAIRFAFAQGYRIAEKHNTENNRRESRETDD